MKKKLFALVMAGAMLSTAMMPVWAEETEAETTAAATSNNVNDPNYEWPDYSGETLSFMWWGSDTRHQLTIEVIE